MTDIELKILLGTATDEENRQYLIDNGQDPVKLVDMGITFIKTTSKNISLENRVRELENLLEQDADIMQADQEQIKQLEAEGLTMVHELEAKETEILRLSGILPLREGDPLGHNVKIYVDENHRPYRACFTIGVQTFYVCEREDKKEAEVFVKMLRTAFDRYALFLGMMAGDLLKKKDKEIQELTAGNVGLLSKLRDNNDLNFMAITDTKDQLAEAIIHLIKLVPIANNRGNLTPEEHEIIKECRDFLSDER